MQIRIIHALLIVFFLVIPFWLYASTDEDYEEGYSRGYHDAKEQVEKEHQEAINQARNQGTADGEAEREASRKEPATERNTLEESYRQGYRDGVEDSRKERERQSDSQEELDTASESNTEHIDESKDQGGFEIHPPRERPQEQPQKILEDDRDPVYQLSLNFSNLYMWNILGLSSLSSKIDYIFQLNNTVLLTESFGFGFNIGMNRSSMGIRLNFYDGYDEFLYSKTADLIHYGLDLNLLFHTRLPVGRFFAFTMDVGWFYTYNITQKVKGLSLSEEIAYEKSDISANYIHMHGPIFQFGFEVGSMRSLGVYVPFGYTLRYKVSHTTFMHGFYVGVGLKI
ncbi:hypothetical protein PVA44_05085 [Entomospira nematocerorum]|uniref:Outer membrane protein beta-barrel domain-containing protein n=1 Tax=Entomospira nematocerorum TaxID=2719987 RepID=A0A968GB85_9SPIO|nr:hypothetical protein [Entomospira nematocera]NIZ46604.1 hypothetical protein [Entomospira nematocera]WDI33598.1 hypothetical protein PVA44_05085 [Entomospira nematocera]